MASLLTSYVTKRGHTVVVLSYHMKVRGGATITRPRARTARSRHALLGRGNRGWVTTELHLNNHDYRFRPGPGLRQTAVATAAQRLPVCACRARQTACWMSRQMQVNSRGDCAGVATTSARQTAFAAGRKQNAAQKSDRQPEPLPANTPVLQARPPPPASWCGS